MFIACIGAEHIQELTAIHGAVGDWQLALTSDCTPSLSVSSILAWIQAARIRHFGSEWNTHFSLRPTVQQSQKSKPKTMFCEWKNEQSCLFTSQLGTNADWIPSFFSLSLFSLMLFYQEAGKVPESMLFSVWPMQEVKGCQFCLIFYCHPVWEQFSLSEYGRGM